DPVQVLHTRVVDQDVGLQGQISQPGRLRQVNLPRLAAYLLGDLFRLLAIDIRDDDVDAGSGKPPCDGGSDAATAPGHQGSTPIQLRLGHSVTIERSHPATYVVQDHILAPIP